VDEKVEGESDNIFFPPTFGIFFYFYQKLFSKLFLDMVIILAQC